LELKHEFTVPASIEETWAAFNDIESVAACFPGATVTSVEGDTFQGSCKVKLGPIALVYNGSGTFVEKDEAARRMVIDAKGKDKRGNGTAGAHVTATMTDAGTGTRVEVLTDLAITGKPAQFGRGVMQDVSDKLLGQFTDCLEKKVGDESAASRAAEAAEADASAEPADVAEPVPDPVERPVNDQAPTPLHGRQDIGGAGQPDAGPPPQADDAIDLGATVLPILARTYWRQALGVIVVLLLLRKLLHRG
jgi:carbon monoxide dehydrogenase subunit G